MSPAAPGAGGPGACEVELASRGVEPRLGSLAEHVVADFYSAHLARSRRDRDRLERSPSGARASSAKWNRQEVYLDEERCLRARSASRWHLARHPEWLEGSSRLDAAALREVVAMQHYLEVDMEDLTLPEAERRSEDSYAGPGGDVCDQMLLDAARGTFVVGGEEFDFSVEVAGHQTTVETNPCEMERLQQAFTDRLVAAVIRCLGDEPPPLLLRAVTTAMSQSGMANVERACSGPQVVVSGGEQALRYELRTVSQDSWEVCASMRKWEFEEFVVVEEAASDEPGKVTIAQCSSSSYIARTCSLRFQVQEGGIHADVCGFSDQVWIVDDKGKPIHLPGQATAKTRTSWRETLSRFVLLGSWHFSPATLLLRCRHCRRRARSVARTLPSGLSLQPLPGMAAALAAEDDPENAMRAPLREPAI